MPTTVATTGSSEPNIDVMVDPANLTADTSVNADNTVANRDSPTKLNTAFVSGIGSSPVVKYENRQKINAPKEIT